MDWTSLLNTRFLYQSKRDKGAIVMGGFVTRIVEQLGVFNQYTTNLKAVGGWATYYVEYWIGMRMLYQGLHGLRPVYHPRDSV